VDTDFFTHPEELRIAPKLQAWLAGEVRVGVPLTFREDHVDLVQSMTTMVDLVVNFDFHMDLRLEFLHGADPLTPPQDASVFETILTAALTSRYVWAHPVSRRADAARAYASAVATGRQPLVSRIHCLPGVEALTMLKKLRISSIFVCRSPAYATADTDRVFWGLRHMAATVSSERRHEPG
jgi:hypothetical protein